MSQRKLKKKLAYSVSLIMILLFWILISGIVKSDLVFPSPFLVFQRFVKLFDSAIFWQNFFATFVRILIAFLISTAVGCLLGFLCGFSDFINDLFQIPLQILRTTPVITVILIVIFWFTSNVVPVFICVLMTLPIMITSVATGFKQNDKDLENLAYASGLKKNQYYFYIKFPISIPYIVNGALQTFGLSWKVILASEVLCIPKRSVGNLLQKAQMNLETADLFAITIFVVLVSFILEKICSYFVKIWFIEKQ